MYFSLVTIPFSNFREFAHKERPPFLKIADMRILNMTLDAYPITNGVRVVPSASPS